MTRVSALALASAVLGTQLLAAPVQASSGPVPGSVAPVVQTPVGEYVDDTRGLFIPSHTQLRGKTTAELANWAEPAAGPTRGQDRSMQNQEQVLNRLATGYDSTGAELQRIASDPGLLDGRQMAQAAFPAQPGSGREVSEFARPRRAAPDLAEMPSLSTGGRAIENVNSAALGVGTPQEATRGTEIAVGGSAMNSRKLDLQNGIVTLREERITVRRALQRMLDQLGGAGWSVVWDLDETNASLPDMEISLYAEEPFIKVLNALLARLQSRSGQPLRVIKYDQTQRLVITDRAASVGTAGVDEPAATGTLAVTDTVLKEARVSLHYEEIPLVDALENMVNQAGRGQWRLRMYAGTDQVLKPAHIEEPFGVALERVLKVFNLRYEIFPGGKLIVVTAGDSFGFRRVN